MYVTADHGMVDIGPEDKLDIDAVPELRAGLALLGREPGTCTPGQAPPRMSWLTGGRCSVIAPGCCRGTRPSRKDGSARWTTGWPPGSAMSWPRRPGRWPWWP